MADDNDEHRIVTLELPASKAKLIRQLSEDDLIVLKDLAEGQRSLKWIGAKMKSLAIWFTVMVGAYLMFAKQVAEWLRLQIGSPGGQ